MNDLFGKALLDYYQGKQDNPLMLSHPFGAPYELDLEGYFYKLNDFSDMEIYAMSMCRGRVLDIGAAAGRHAVYLQKEFEVDALDISENCKEVLTGRGVKNVIQDDIFTLNRNNAYDTLFLMLNGIGIAGTIEQLTKLLTKFHQLTTSKGQVIFDSSDISYLYAQKPSSHYFGEVEYSYEYNGIKGNDFKWLYIDVDLMYKMAKEANWKMEVVFEDDDNGYLAVLDK